MRIEPARGVYSELGVRRVINARGSVTALGGSSISRTVQAAMDQANDHFVDMADLLTCSGRAVAAMLGADAALITSGCFAALVLGAAAIMTGRDPAGIARLPDTSGLPRTEFLIQTAMRYRYDRAPTVAGGALVEVGDAEGTTAEQLESAIGPHTAGILYLARGEGAGGTLRIPDVVRIARRKGVATLVDAAAEVFPLERMKWLAGESGIDLVCFGAKYVGSVQSAGFLCGRKDLVEAAFQHSFIGFEVFENRSLGRGYKTDRQEIIATVVALREWLATDHAARLAEQERRIRVIARALDGIPHVTAESTWPRQGPWMQLRVSIAPQSHHTVTTVDQALRDGDPSVWVRVDDDTINIAVHTLKEGEDAVVGERMRQVLLGLP